MTCRKCGKFTLFRDVCWSCERLSGSRSFVRLEGKHEIKFHRQTKILKVTINGAEQTFDATSGLGEDVMQELAAHLHMPITQLEELLHLGDVKQSPEVTISRSETHQTVPARTNQSQETQGATTRKHATLMNCPKCSHRIAADAAWCLYCGHDLVKAVSNVQPLNEVDKAFLEHDVKSESKTEAKQELDSFSERLKDM